MRKGFTLLEVIVVMALMAVMAGFVTLYFAGSAGRSHVAKTAREISGTIRQGRVLAVEQGEEQTLVLDLDSRVFGVEGKASRTIPPDITLTISDPLAGQVTRGKYSLRLLPSGGVLGGSILLTKGQSAISIYPDPIVGVRVGK